MKAARGLRGSDSYLLAPGSEAWEWIPTLGAAGAVALVYFLAARLGLALLSAPSDVAVFWPASGIAAGILIVAGRRAYPAVVIGVVVGTVAANVMSDRSLLTSLFKGFCNSGEAVLAAWLLEQWFDRPFRFGDLRRILGFLAAAGLAAVASAIGGAASMTLLNADTTAPYWDVWRAWFLSDGVGIVVVAPLMIGLAQVWRKPPSGGELIEGLGVLGLVALVCLYTMSQKTGSWLSFSPNVLVLPLLLWLTARCPPNFGIAGAFLVSVSIIFATTFGIGRFGDAAVPIMERVIGAQVATMNVTFFALVLAVLFTQRKEAEEGLRDSERRLAKERTMLARLHGVSSRLWLKRNLHEALDEILAGAIELMGADMGTIRLWDSARGSLRIEAHRGFACEYLDLFRQIPVKSTPPCENVLRSGERMVTEDIEQDHRFAPFRSLARAAGYRALQSTRILSREGAPLGVLGTHFRSVHKPAEQDLSLLDLYVRQAADIIERHKAEDALRKSEERLRERDAQLALAGRAALVGNYTYDINKGTSQVSEGYAAIHGLPEGTTETSYSEWRASVHPEDLDLVERVRDLAFAYRRKEDNAEYRIVLSTGEVRWIERRGSISYGEDGRPERVVGVNIDVTERKQSELALADRDSQLVVAGKIGRVGSFTFDFGSRRLQVSPGYSAIHGLPEGTVETNLIDLRARVHPNDFPPVELQIQEAIAARRREYSCEYRIILASGEVRWIESRAAISYDNIDGEPKRAAGVDIDVTERKRAEAQLLERNAQLELASKIAGVGSFVVDYDAGVIRLSSGYATLLGLPDSTVELSPDNIRMLIHPEDLPRLEAQRDQAFLEQKRELVAEFRIIRADNREVRWVEARSIMLYKVDGRPLCMIGVRIDVTDRKKAEDHKNLLISELDHRVKNTLAAVVAIVEQTRASSNSIDAFLLLLRGRIRSLANTHALLSLNRWRGIAIGELVRGELAPCMRDGNTLIEGPDIHLTADAVQVLAIVLHELTTNAAKYGALSNGAGRVSVRWDWCSKESLIGGVILRWRETGGPTVSASAKPGYGTEVIRDLIPYELGGSVDYVLEASGVRCKLVIPDKWLTGGGRLDA